MSGELRIDRESRNISFPLDGPTNHPSVAFPFHLSETRNACARRLHGYPTFFDPR
jgi:hypothetical protein